MDSQLMNELSERPLSEAEKQYESILDVKPLGEDGKKFRFQNQRVLFTYKGHLPKTEYIEWFCGKINTTPKFIRLAHETGDDRVPYNHTHVVVDIGHNFQTTNPRFFDLEVEGEESGNILTIHPHIRTLRSVKALNDAKIYIAKEDPENADLKSQDSLFAMKVDKVMSTRNPLEAVRGSATSFSDVLGILQLHSLNNGDYRSKKPDWSTVKPRPWQKELYDFLVNNEPDGRSVYWVYDKEGGQGKTFLGDWLEDTQGNDFYYCDDLGNSRDAATIIRDKLASGWTAKGILVDLARSSETHTRMYNYLERLANGRITSQKYRGSTVKFNKPHVVVFANYLPLISEMSLDRWKIFRLNDLNLERMTIDEVKEELTPNKLDDNSPYHFKNIQRLLITED